MTKEELEKEAEVFATYYESLFPNEFEIFYKAFLKVAEPREKRISDLEAQIEKMKSDVLSLIKDRMNDDIDQSIIERLAEKWEIKENEVS